MLTTTVAVTAASVSAAGTTLTTGDIAFVRYNADTSPDDFSFVLLKAIVSGTEITFTDKGWLSSGGFRGRCFG